jgi:uncharacterized lipoprotein YddW (UPF0748 family)
MVSNTVRFSDIEQHWAKPFIEGLARLGIVSGFPDGTYRPSELVTRAQFASLLGRAFDLPKKRNAVTFSDVPTNHWAVGAIREAYEMQFLSGYPGNRFSPEQAIPRVQILVALVTGLEVTGKTVELNQFYRDAITIPNYATSRIEIATDREMVVNAPDVQLLQPNVSATRGDVAALLYQALVQLDRAPKLQSSYIVRRSGGLSPGGGGGGGSTVAVSHARELRGIWLASVWNINWPSRRDLSSERQQAEFVATLDRMVELNLNAVVLQVRPEGDTLYASQLEPWSAWLTGTQGKAPNPYYDPLEFAIAECRKRNIEFHAWFNPYRARTSASVSTLVRPHLGATNPELVYTYGNQLWMDPGAKVVQDRAYNVIMDVVQRYDIDGIHLDDYFYPYPIAGTPFPDSNTYNTYRDRGGTLSLGDWRRDNVNQMMKRLYTGIKSAKPHVRFGISPFGLYRPGQPPTADGLDQYAQLFADPLKWQQEGWVDYLAPQLYWLISQSAQSYPMLLDWWVENNPKKRHIYAGNNLAKLGEGDWVFEEFEEQVGMSRDRAAQLSLGNIYYNMKPFLENRNGIVDDFKRSIYSTPALPPTYPWIVATPPAPPVEVKASNRQITWKAPSGQVRSWTLYRQSGNSWQLRQILTAATTQVTVDSGTYAVCTVDRLNNESVGAIVSV